MLASSLVQLHVRIAVSCQGAPDGVHRIARCALLGFHGDEKASKKPYVPAVSVCLGQAFVCAHPKKTQGRQNSRNWKLKKKTQTQEKITVFRHFFRVERINIVRKFDGLPQIY